MRYVNMIFDESDSADEIEIIKFGLQMMISSVVGITVAVVISLLLGELWQGVILLAVIIPLRQYAGGFHMRTRAGCAVLSLCIFVSAILLIKYVQVNLVILICLFLGTAIVIAYFAPVDNVENELDCDEKTVYGNRARIVLAVEILAVMLLILLHQYEWSYIIVVGLSVCAALVLAGKVKNSLEEGC